MVTYLKNKIQKVHFKLIFECFLVLFFFQIICKEKLNSQKPDSNWTFLNDSGKTDYQLKDTINPFSKNSLKQQSNEKYFYLSYDEKVEDIGKSLNGVNDPDSYFKNLKLLSNYNTYWMGINQDSKFWNNPTLTQNLNNNQFAPICETCVDSCPACGFTTTPSSGQVTSNCVRYDFETPVCTGETATRCHSFIATNTYVDFQVSLSYAPSCQGPGNVSTFTWELYEYPTCDGVLQTGNLSNLTFTNLTLGQEYVYCYTFSPSANCCHGAHYPYFVGAQCLNPPPPPTVVSPVTFCQFASTGRLTAIGTDLTWYLSLNSDPLTLAPAPNTSVTGTFFYYVTQSIDGCNSLPAVIEVIVSESPIPVVNNTGPFCLGETVMLVASGGTNYSWSGPNGFQSNVQNPVISSANGLMSGIYIVTVTANGSCSSTANTVVVVENCCFSDAGTLGNLSSQTYCPDNIPLSATVTGNNIDNGYNTVFFLTQGSNILQQNSTGIFNLPPACGAVYNIYAYNYLIGNAVESPNSLSDINCTLPNCCSLSQAVTISVDDNQPPIFQQITDVMISCLDDIPVFESSSWTDNCLGFGDQSEFTDSGFVDICFGGVITRNWQVTDACGNVGTAIKNYILPAPEFTECDDGDPCTINDIIKLNCNGSVCEPCRGTMTQGVMPTFDLKTTYCHGETAQILPLISTNGISGIWNPAVINNNQSGSYTFVPASDQCAINFVLIVTIYNLSATAIVSNPSCAGINDGSITIQPIGGVAPITYSLDGFNFQMNNTFNTLSSGAYTIYVRDVNNCLRQFNDTISDGPFLNFQIVEIDPLCFSSADGKLEINITAGMEPYHYQWISGSESGSGTGTEISGLNSGAGSATVTDSNGCSGSRAFNISQPSTLVLECTKIADVSSPGNNDGMITVQVSGGTTDYILTWVGPDSIEISRDSLGEGLHEIENLFSGTHFITLTDKNDCITTCEVFIDEPGCSLSIADTITHVSCFGQKDGSIKIVVTDNFGMLRFEWNDTLVNGNNPGNLKAGMYRLTITDEADCQAVRNYTINQRDTLIVTCQIRDTISVPGGVDGSFSVEISGGIGLYQLSWNGTDPFDGLLDSLESDVHIIAALGAGEYHISVTDMNDCESTCSLVLNQPGCNLIINENINHVSCYGGSDGSILVSVNNANGNIVYNWGDTLLSGSNVMNMKAGSYTVTVTDEANCFSSKNFIINEPEKLNINCVAQNEVSFPNGDDGMISVEINGGISQYFIFWVGPGSTEDSIIGATPGSTILPDLLAGNYVISVFDNNNCSAECNLTITQPDCNLNIDYNITPVSCFGGNDGSIEINLNNGYGPASYQWNVTSLSGSNPSYLNAGMYDLTITDEAGCQLLQSFLITEPESLDLLCQESEQASTALSTDGKALINISNGSAPYKVVWDGPTIDSILNYPDNILILQDLTAGNYSVTITDSLGCLKTCVFEITVVPDVCSISISDLKVNACFDNNTGVDETDDTFSMEFRVTGTLTASNFTLFINNIASGIYNYNETVIINNLTSNGQEIFISVVDSENPQCIFNEIISSLPCSSCNGTVDAGPDQTITCGMTSVTLNAAGTGSISQYTWSGPDNFIANSSSVDITQDGFYTVSVLFGNGCSATDEIQVLLDNTLPVAFVGPKQLITCTDTIIKLSGRVSENLSDVSYQWTDSGGVVIGNDSTVIVALEGEYFFRVTNNQNQCKSELASQTVTNIQNEPLAIIYANPTNILDCVVQSVILNHEQEDHVEYFWSFNDVTFLEGQIIVTEKGTAFLTAVDTITGCDNMTLLEIKDLQDYPFINITQPAPITCMDTFIIINASSSQSGSNIIYQWLGEGGEPIDGADSNELSTDQPGKYFLILTDTVNYCSNIDSIVVQIFNEVPLIVTENEKTISCLTDNVLLTSNGSSTGSEFIYTWLKINNNTIVSTQQTATVSEPGNYLLNITNDINGCQNSKTILVLPPSIPEFEAEIDPITCFGANDGSITISSIEGGTPPFIYSLTDKPDSSDPFFRNLGPALYNINITDISGCSANSSVTLAQPDILELIVEGIDSIRIGDKTILELKSNIPEENIKSVLWTPQSSISCPDCLQIEAFPTQTTQYLVQLEDINGCKVETNITIFVNRIILINIPNIFTPNGDGVNDNLSVFTNVPSLVKVEKFAIYDRWGNSVFYKENMDINDLQSGWDGRNNGQFVSNGVYVYVVEVLINDTEKEVIIGDITIRR